MPAVLPLKTVDLLIVAIERRIELEVEKKTALKKVERCVVCGRNLPPRGPEGREFVDTCGKRCFKKLLVEQRKNLSE